MKTREEIIQRCKDKGACMGEFIKLLAAKNDNEFWCVLMTNYIWCKCNNIFDERPDKIEFPKVFGGSLDLRGCNLAGVTLPNEIGGSLYLSGCEIPNTEQFKKFKDIIIN